MIFSSRYYWDVSEGRFVKLEGLETRMNIGDLHNSHAGLTETESQRRSFLFGRNEIVVPLESIFMLMVKEILTPFYVFQVFSITFWFCDEYWKYSTAILITSPLPVLRSLPDSEEPAEPP